MCPLKTKIMFRGAKEDTVVSQGFSGPERPVPPRALWSQCQCSFSQTLADFSYRVHQAPPKAHTEITRTGDIPVNYEKENKGKKEENRKRISNLASHHIPNLSRI